MSTIDIFDDYKKLLAKVDAFCEKINDNFVDELACTKGCSECCRKVLSFVPVEFFYIVDHIARNEIDAAIVIENIDAILSKKSKACPLLHDDECLVYDARPVICRTFGMPAVVMNDDGETADLQICDKNFLTDGLKLTKENIINIDTLNSMLFIVNSAFVKIHQGYADTGARLSVLEIINYI